MPVQVEKISIALPPAMARQIRVAVKSGEYASNSEVVRDALRDWTHKHERKRKYIAHLRKLVEEADNDPRPSIPAEQALQRIRARLGLPRVSSAKRRKNS